MNNILKIIYDYSINNKVLDVNAIERIIDEIISYKNISEYVLGLKIISEKNVKLADFDKKSKIVNINFITINRMLQIIDIKLKTNDLPTKYFYKNFRVLQVILHEMEHASQEKNMANENTFETLLIKISSEFDCDSYFSMYDYLPSERLAEIKSFNDVMTISSKLYSIYPNLIELIRSDRMQRQIKGFRINTTKEVESPFLEFIIKAERNDIIERVSQFINATTEGLNKTINEFPLCERLMYGFPIRLDEYAEHMKLMLSLTNKNFNNKIFLK